MAKFSLIFLLFCVQVSVVSADPDNPRIKQRAAIQFLVSLGMANPNIYHHLVNSFGAAAYSRANANRWA